MAECRCITDLAKNRCRNSYSDGCQIEVEEDHISKIARAQNLITKALEIFEMDFRLDIRTDEMVFARFMVARILKRDLQLPLTQIAVLIKNKPMHHASIINALRKADNLLALDKKFAAKYAELRKCLFDSDAMSINRMKSLAESIPGMLEKDMAVAVQMIAQLNELGRLYQMQLNED
jgi:hypothetical protein